MLKKITKNAALLFAGTASGQLIVLVCSPLITRLYTPFDFGFFAVYAALLYLFGSIASLRFEVAIPLVKNELDANALAVGCVYLVFFFTIVLFILFKPLVYILDLKSIEKYWYMLPVGFLFFGLYNIAIYTRLRTSDHKVIAHTRISQAVGGVIIQIGLGILNVGSIGLVIGQVFGISGGLFKLHPPRVLLSQVKATKFSRLKSIFGQNSAFAKYDSPAALLNVANNQLPPIIIASLFSPFAAGIYALVQRVMLTPLSILATSISGSLVSNGRELSETRSGAVSQIASVSALVSPCLTVVSLVSPIVFGHIFGEKWELAGIVAAWIGLTVAPKFSYDSVSIMLSTNGLQVLAFKIQSLMTLGRVAILLVGSKYLSLPDTILLFSLVSALGYAVSSWLVQWKIEDSHINELWPTLLDVLLSFAIVIAVYRFSVGKVLAGVVIISYVGIVIYRCRDTCNGLLRLMREEML